MRTQPLERKLLWGVVAIFVIPTALAEGILIVLYRRGVFQDAWGLLLTVLIGLPALMAYLGWIAHALGRPLAHTVKMIRDGTELMSTVNPDHRIQVRTGDELEALADDINRLADHLRDAERGVAVRVAEATRGLQAERVALAAILEALGGRRGGRDPRRAHHACERGRPGAAGGRWTARRPQPLRPRRSLTDRPMPGSAPQPAIAGRSALPSRRRRASSCMSA